MLFSFANVTLIMKVADCVHCSSSDNLRVLVVGVCPHSRKNGLCNLTAIRASPTRSSGFCSGCSLPTVSSFAEGGLICKGNHPGHPGSRWCLIRAGVAGLSTNSATSQVDGLVTHPADVEASPAATGLREFCEASAEGLPEEPDAMFEVLLAPPDRPLPKDARST